MTNKRFSVFKYFLMGFLNFNAFFLSSIILFTTKNLKIYLDRIGSQNIYELLNSITLQRYTANRHGLQFNRIRFSDFIFLISFHHTFKLNLLSENICTIIRSLDFKVLLFCYISLVGCLLLQQH